MATAKLICPILWDKMLTMGNVDFLKEYNGTIVDCTKCDIKLISNSCDKIKGKEEG